MESTSCQKDCPFVKQGFCSNEKECPNYVESWWIEGQTQEKKLVKDCSPKRMLLQQQVLQLRLESVQEALELTRNQQTQLLSYLKPLFEASQQILNSTQKLDRKNENIDFFICNDSNTS